MESLLTRLVTYKLMDGSSLVNILINQPIGQLLFSILIFITIIGTSLYALHRTLFQDKVTCSRGSTFKKVDSKNLIDLWINQNQRYCVDLMKLCVAFVNSHVDRIRVPNGVQNISFLPHVSSPLMCSQMTSPTVSADTMSIPVLITANRLSFSCQRQGSHKLSHIKFSLSNFSLEVVLNLSFNQTDIIALRGVCSHPQFSLSIESIDPLKNAKQDLMSTIEGIVANLPFIWKNADSLLQSQDLYKGLQEFDEPFSDLDSNVITADDEEVHNFCIEHEKKKTIERPSELDLQSVDSSQETSSAEAVLLTNGDADKKAVSQPSSDSACSTEVLHETVVLAHNPSLKKKLNSSIRRRRHHQRSASDFVNNLEDETELPGTNFNGEPVPLDPIVHPPEDQHQVLAVESHQQPESKSISHQRMLKRVTDVSPLHERGAPNLASKNLLVKVVKADFIDLKNSSDAYCVVELDEPYQRHATHVVPPSEQLFWDQHLLFGLNSNSKRAAFEVFELSKRRKSISRGYAEVYLPDLLTSMVGGCSSELLRCISLDPKQHASSTSGLVGGPGGPTGGGGCGAWEFVSSPVSSSTSLTIRKPTVTVEFHFMERIMDDPFSVCKGRLGIGSPAPLSKLKAATITSPTSSSDSSLSQTAGGTASSDSGPIAAPNMPAAVNNTSTDRSPHGSKERMSDGSGQMEAETPKDVTPTPNTDGTVKTGQQEGRLQRSTSTRGSRLFEPAYENLRMADTNAAALCARQHLKGFRRKSSVPRVLSGLGTSAGGSTTSSGFGLLGPSSQLAGVVAGLTAASVESSDASVDPSTAAAVASAVAVAAATGRSTSASVAVDRRGLAGVFVGSGVSGGLADSLFEGIGSSMAALGHSEHEPLGDTVVRYAAPAANIAESFGTYSAQPPLKRPDATGTKLMNLFKSKKKQQPSGMARLLYLQNLEGSEFDAISTEGYQRIVHGDRMEKQ